MRPEMERRCKRRMPRYRDTGYHGCRSAAGETMRYALARQLHAKHIIAEHQRRHVHGGSNAPLSSPTPSSTRDRPRPYATRENHHTSILLPRRLPLPRYTVRGILRGRRATRKVARQRRSAKEQYRHGAHRWVKAVMRTRADVCAAAGASAPYVFAMFIQRRDEVAVAVVLHMDVHRLCAKRSAPLRKARTQRYAVPAQRR